ncbi:MAG: hypothetical protein HY973_03530 [Candidatus Kerfeldbacteria bacterium]|nr:hypothetical protein [Candidatus Kerfeldbacteria bacterium]
MATPNQVPSKQKRFLQDDGVFINLGKRESKSIADMCRFFKFGNSIICLDQAKKKIYLLVKNKNSLFAKKQTLRLKAGKFK